MTIITAEDLADALREALAEVDETTPEAIERAVAFDRHATDLLNRWDAQGGDVALQYTLGLVSDGSAVAAEERNRADAAEKQRDATIARAERAEAEVERLRAVLGPDAGNDAREVERLRSAIRSAAATLVKWAVAAGGHTPSAIVASRLRDVLAGKGFSDAE